MKENTVQKEKIKKVLEQRKAFYRRKKSSFRGKKQERNGSGLTVSAGEREDSVQISSQDLSDSVHQSGVVGCKQSKVIARDIVEPTAGHVQLHVHTGPLPSLVELSDHSNGSQVGVLAVERTAERNRLPQD